MHPSSLNELTALTTEAEVLKHLLERRHSCRAFMPEALQESRIRQMLQTAQRTASWCNTQPWRIFVSSGQSTHRLRSSLREAAVTGTSKSDLPFPRSYEGRHLERRRASGRQLYAAAEVPMGDRDAAAKQALRNFELFDAPHVLILATPRYLGTYGVVDCGAWIANFLLAAEAMGIAAIPQAALATQAEVLRKHFSIAEDLDIVCGISFGIGDTSSPLNSYRTARADLSEVCEWFST